MPPVSHPVSPPVSIVLTTYNRAAALAATLDTLLVQTFGDFELIVCDDCSPDNTEEVVRRYRERDSRIRYHRHAKNVGMPGNLNEGIRLSRGEYIANLHDGDLYVPQLLEKWKAALDRNPGAAFVFNKYGALAEDGSLASVSGEDLPEVFPGAVLLEKIYFRRWRFDSPVWGTVMGRRSAYFEAGLFDPRFGFLSDVDMWMKLAEKHQVAFLSEPLINIPTRDTLPRQWNLKREDIVLRKMFWEARVRHYRGRPAPMALEAAKHAWSVTWCLIYLAMLRTNAALRGRNRRKR
jgi:glycosyltransferase involved in cell wall biosynthesis